jgi:hypothetical protein
MPKRTRGAKHGRAKKPLDVNQPADQLVRESTEPPDFETAAIEFLSQIRREIGRKGDKIGGKRTAAQRKEAKEPRKKPES